MGKRRQRDQKLTRGEPPLLHSVMDLLQHEVKTLEKMATIGGWPPVLHAWKKDVYAASKKALNTGKLDIHLRFTARDPRASAIDPKHTVELCSKIIPGDTPFVTYGFAIGVKENNGQYRGLRKFHFDLDITQSSDEPKPVIHLQYPGRMWPVLCEVGYQKNAFDFLNPKLDKPRIPCLPISIALLAHIALLEYVSVDNRIAIFITSPGWLKSVTHSEQYILKTFLDHSLTWLNKTENEKKSLISYFYRYPSD